MRFAVGFLLAATLFTGGSEVRFADVTQEAGIGFRHAGGGTAKDYILETIGSGVAWLDFDRDGWMDLYLVNGGRWEELLAGRRSVSSALYRNRGDGTFADVTKTAGAGGSQWGMGVAAADVDNDGWTDLFVANYGRDTLLRNRGDGSFEDVSEKSGLDSPAWSSSAAFADYDNAGLLDLYVTRYVRFDHRQAPAPNCKYRQIEVHCGPKGMTAETDTLYRNNGDGTFTDVTSAAGLTVPPAYGLGVSWLDFDEDGDPDLFVANDSTPNFLFRNDGGRFQEIGLISGFAYSEDGNAQAGMGIAVGDHEGDGRLDLYLTHFSDDYNTLYANAGEEQFRDLSYQAKVAFPSWQFLGWGAFFFDYDHDGLVDLFVANGHIYPQVDRYQIGTSFAQRNQLLRNLGQGKFEEIRGAGPALEQALSSRGAAYADFDNDGDLDVVVNNMDAAPSLLRNEGGNRSGHWISLALEGTDSNRQAVGARVEVVAGGLRQVRELQAGSSYQSSHDPRLHFGLGSSARVEEVRVRWPSGKKQILRGLPADRFFRLREGSEPVEVPARPTAVTPEGTP